MFSQIHPRIDKSTISSAGNRLKRDTRVLISTRNILMKYSYAAKTNRSQNTSPHCPHVNTVETIWPWIMDILVSRELYETCTEACHILERWCSTVFLRVTKRKFELESDIEDKMKDERRGWKKPTARDIPYYTYIDPVGCLRGAAVLLNIDRGTVQSPRVDHGEIAFADLYETIRADQRDVTVCHGPYATHRTFFLYSRARFATTFHFKCTRDTRWLMQIYLQAGPVAAPAIARLQIFVAL